MGILAKIKAFFSKVKSYLPSFLDMFKFILKSSLGIALEGIKDIAIFTAKEIKDDLEDGKLDLITDTTLQTEFKRRVTEKLKLEGREVSDLAINLARETAVAWLKERDWKF